MKVFISHTYEIARFPEEHPFLRAALDGAREAGWAIDEMEDFPAASAPPAAECERRVRACDAFVAIIGFLWGSEVPENPGLSYVEFEFESALAARKPTLVFVIDEQATGFPAGLTEGMSARERDLQKAFRRRIVAEAGAKGLIYKKLTEPHKLQHAVFRSLSELRPSNEHPSVPQPTPKTRVSTERLPAVGGTLFGRDDLLRQLDDAWRTRQANVVCLIGPAGAGKTALTNNWLSSLAAEKYRDASAVFAWSFDSQEVDQSEVSADKFVTELFKFCGEHEPPMNATERGRRLAQIVSSQAVILVLDGIEAAQDPREPHELKDPAVRVLLRILAAQNPCLCLVSSGNEIY